MVFVPSHPNYRVSAALALPSLLPAGAAELTPEAINAAAYDGGPLPDDRSAITAKVQILLDRIGASPGIIDGHLGENVGKAVRGAEIMLGLPEDGVFDEDIWQRISAYRSPVIVRHTISDGDVSDIVAPRLHLCGGEDRRDLPHGYRPAPATQSRRRFLRYRQRDMGRRSVGQRREPQLGS